VVITRNLRPIAYLAPLLRAGLLTGMAVAVMAFPLVAVIGYGGRTAADFVHRLPDTLRPVPSAQVSYVYAADGRTPLTQFYEEYRRYVPLRQISPHMTKAIVASEDARFFEHNGVDIKGILRAAVANQQAGGVSQGASTLTMQYVRNVQRDSARNPQEVIEATERTNVRKLREMRMAVQVERDLSKQQILERYLNVAYFGHRAYGIYAAAEVFFSRKPIDLTLAEAASLAGLVKAPSEYDPAGPNPEGAQQRRNYVIDRMVEMRYVPRDVGERTKREKLRLRLTDPPNDCVSVRHNSWGFFCDMFKSWWRAQAAFGSTPQQREENLRRGGYSIVTSLDPNLQRISMEEVRRKERLGSTFALGVVAIEPGTGRIRAAAVNRRYSLDQRGNGRHTDRRKERAGVPSNYPNTVVPLLGGGDMPGYQAGSTFKIFTLVAALDLGLPLSTSLYAPSRLVSIYPTSPTDPSRCAGTRWCPRNASRSMTGRQNLWSGFGKSVNTFFVRLEQLVGAERAVRMAERLGLTWHTEVDRRMASTRHADDWGSFTLGVADTTPLEMANAYATIAADGRYCEPLPVRSITDSAGRPVAAGSPRCHQAVRRQVARAAVDATRCVTGYGAARGRCGGWSTAPGVYGAVGRPVGGKTGTTDDTRAAWFVGITPRLAAASFIADPDNPFHVAGDWNAWKPIQTVSNLLRRGLKGTRVHRFTPPTHETSYRGARNRP
jgi:membrane peptidoglycan carboxypeptidase